MYAAVIANGVSDDLTPDIDAERVGALARVTRTGIRSIEEGVNAVIIQDWAR